MHTTQRSEGYWAVVVTVLTQWRPSHFKPITDIQYIPYSIIFFIFHYFRKMYTFPPIFVQFTCFCLIYVFLASTYFEHDHALLDAPDLTRFIQFYIYEQDQNG